MVKEWHPEEFPFGHVSLVGVLEFNQHIVPVLVQNFDLLNVAIVAKKVEQIRYLLLVVVGLRQIFDHQHFRMLATTIMVSASAAAINGSSMRLLVMVTATTAILAAALVVTVSPAETAAARIPTSLWRLLLLRRLRRCLASTCSSTANSTP